MGAAVANEKSAGRRPGPGRETGVSGMTTRRPRATTRAARHARPGFSLLEITLVLVGTDIDPSVLLLDYLRKRGVLR